ncbi:hypothetical protein IIC38_16790 [candidate division KSB1 bacterium]|nr:hypothetical protein [candidate division KSB1 bacterium]
MVKKCVLSYPIPFKAGSPKKGTILEYHLLWLISPYFDLLSHAGHGSAPGCIRHAERGTR